MKDYFELIRSYLLELEMDIVYENKEDAVFIIQKEEDGITNLMIGVANPILILEQFIFNVSEETSSEVYKALLKKNRDIIHGAFVLDESGKRVIFRDTLQLENLDLNELEGTLNSLSLLLTEYSDQIIDFAQVKQVEH